MTPADPLDDRLAAAFNDHQRRPTERGRLLGPDAVAFAVELFSRLGAAVLVRPSPWRKRCPTSRSSKYLPGIRIFSYLCQQLIFFHSLAGADEQAGDHPGGRGFYADFHLHGFKQEQRLALLDSLALLHLDGAYLGRHGRAYGLSTARLPAVVRTAGRWALEAVGAAVQRNPFFGAVGCPIEGQRLAVE